MHSGKLAGLPVDGKRKPRLPMKMPTVAAYSHDILRGIATVPADLMNADIDHSLHIEPEHCVVA